MPTSIHSLSGEIACMVIAERGEEPRIRIRISLNEDHSRWVDLNVYQAEDFATVLMADVRHAKGFGELNIKGRDQ